MADDDDDFDGTNMDARMQVDNTILKLAGQQAASLRRSKAETDERAVIASNVKKLGVPPKAWRQAVTMMRIMDPTERKEHQRGLKRVMSVLGEHMADLFPEDVEKQQARASRKKEREAKAAAAAGKETPEQQERRLAADSNPRSDPKSGGAGKRPRKPKAVKEQITIHDTVAAGDALISSTAAQLNAADEQAEGDSILSDHIAEMDKLANEHTVPETEGEDATGLTGKTGFGSISDEKPLSQGEIARQKREAAFGSES